MRRSILLMGAVLLIAGAADAGPALSPAAREAVEADWERQEGVRGRTPGSKPSIEAAIDRGRRLAADLERHGALEAAQACRRRLDDVERRAADLFARLPPGKAAPPLTSPEGLHLVRASICGAGKGLDEGRVRGKDYTYHVAMMRGSAPSELNTVAWDPDVVVYRFEGLSPKPRTRLRVLYGSDAHRKLQLSVDGIVLDTVDLQAGLVIDRWSDLPKEALADGRIEIQVKHLGGANAVISAIEVWSSEPVADPREREALTARHARVGDWIPPAHPEALALFGEARWAVRELAMANPALDFEELLFVKRQWPHANHQCAHRVGEAQIPGANLCILRGLRPDGVVRELLPPELAEKCGVGRPDLSFDGRRIVFPLALPRDPPTPYPFAAGHAKYDPKDPANSDAYRGGSCHMYDIWEIGVDGKGLRRLTHDDRAEDTEPCYLPDGRICFTSSRDGRLVQCGDWALVFGLFVMNADGSGQHAITEPQDTEFYPAMLEDGRILYTRWDYVMKAYNVIQQLWVVNPDGTRVQLAYGDWFSFSRGPLALQEARQILGTRKVIAVGAAHHNTCAGPLMIADLDQNRGGASGMANITPEIGYPEAYAPDERVVKALPDIPPISNTHNATGWFSSPWPLNERHFLACHTLSPYNGDRHGYGIYLVDVHGNKELIYRGEGFSCYAPIPLKQRRRPHVIPPLASPGEGAPGLLYVQDVYAGLEGVPRGAVKWLRVCESYVKKRHTNPHRCDAGSGSGWDFRGVLGTVPVEADGSAYFEAPAGKLLFFEALDGDHLEIRRMRNYLNLQPGETQGCVGCHEPASAAPPSGRKPLATRRPPARIQPPPWGAGPMRFAKVVQPVLDRRCAGCHDGSAGQGKSFDLRGFSMVKAPAPYDGDEGPQHCVSDSFLALLPHVRYVKLGGHHGAKLPLPPYTIGSGASPLMRMLKEGHHGVRLPEAEWRALAAWIDCNAPFYGSYDDEIVIEPRTASR